MQLLIDGELVDGARAIDLVNPADGQVFAAAPCADAAQVERAVTLRERLPRVAAIYAQGLVDAVLIGMIVSRTDLIIDDEALNAIVDKAVSMKTGVRALRSLVKGMTSQA